MPTTLPLHSRKKGVGGKGAGGSGAKISVTPKKDTTGGAGGYSGQPGGMSQQSANDWDMTMNGPSGAGSPDGFGESAAASSASPPVGGADAGAGALGGLSIGISSRMSPDARVLGETPPPQYYDPAPTAINRFSVGNASRGNINLGGLWKGATPNAGYDPLAGASPTNTPYEGTSGFTGGLKRLFLGNNANELNARAIDQSNAMRFGDQARREKVADAIAQAGGIAQATGELGKTGAQTAAIADANNRDNAIQPLVVDDMRAKTASTVGNENRAGQRFQYELPAMAEQLRGDQARNDEFENNAGLRRDALAGENIWRNTQTSNAVADDYRKAQLFPGQLKGAELENQIKSREVTAPKVSGNMIIDPNGGISTYNEFGDMPGVPQGNLRTLRLPVTGSNDTINGVPVGQLGPTPALQPLAGAGARSTFAPPTPRPPSTNPVPTPFNPPTAPPAPPTPRPMGSIGWMQNLGRTEQPVAYDPLTDPANQAGLAKLAELMAGAAASAKKKPSILDRVPFGN